MSFVSLGDMCDVCKADAALPGQILCAGCMADRQAERFLRDLDVRKETEQHEAQVLEKDVA